jgi:hypothetical protein
MKLHPNRAESGGIIPIWIILMALLAALAMLAYLFAHLLRIPPRQLPADPDSNLLPYLAEQIPPIPDIAAREIITKNCSAPDGWQWKPVPFLSSTNLIDWETISANVNEDGSFTTPDGAILGVDPIWDDDLECYTEWRVLILHPGSSPQRFFKWP